LWATQRLKKDDILRDASLPLGFSKDGRTLAALTPGNGVVFYDSATKEPGQQFPVDEVRPGGVAPVAISADLRTLVVGLDDGRVKIWNTETRESNVVEISERPVEFVALSPDGRTLIAGGAGQPVRLRDLADNTNVTLPFAASRVVLSSDGQLLAALSGRPPGPPSGPPRAGGPGGPRPSSANTVRIWDLARGAMRTELSAEARSVRDGTFSPDGRIFATAGFDDVIRLWDTTSGKLVGSCTGNKQIVITVAFSPDGKTLASTGDDSTLRLWNVATQQELLTLLHLGSRMNKLMFSPDGSLLVGAISSTSESGGIRFYRAPAFSEATPAP
jgi:WD40 repeat protein